MDSTPLPTSRRFVTKLLESLSSLHQPREHNAAGSNPLSNAPDAVKKQLLSLQVLFPNEFVPALDLLDRRLVTRFHIQNTLANEASGPATTSHAAEQDANQSRSEEATIAVSENSVDDHKDDQIMRDANMEEHASAKPTSNTNISTVPQTRAYDPTNTTYYVRSAQQRHSRFSTSYDTTTSYEVHLLAWNCSCPAFAFAAFPAMHPEPPIQMYSAEQGKDRDERESERNWVFGGVSLGEDMPPVCKHLLACVLVERCSGLFRTCVEERNVCVEEAAGWAAGWGD